MAVAMKCDNCDRLSEHRPKSNYDFGGLRISFRDISFKFGYGRALDLCPVCDAQILPIVSKLSKDVFKKLIEKKVE